MVTFLKTKRSPGRPRRPRATSISFSAKDLEALGQLVAAGQVALQRTAPVVPRVQAAMTRLGLKHPRGTVGGARFP
jgi:hypothetical protein